MVSLPIACIALVASLIALSGTDAGKAGGLGAAKPADLDAQVAVKAVNTRIIEQLGANAAALRAVSYATQVVAGTNLFIKIQLGESKNYIHVRIFRDLQGKHTLNGIESGHTATDAITYFDAKPMVSVTPA